MFGWLFLYSQLFVSQLKQNYRLNIKQRRKYFIMMENCNLFWNYHHTIPIIIIIGFIITILFVYFLVHSSNILFHSISTQLKQKWLLDLYMCLTWCTNIQFYRFMLHIVLTGNQLVYIHRWLQRCPIPTLSIYCWNFVHVLKYQPNNQWSPFKYKTHKMEFSICNNT